MTSQPQKTRFANGVLNMKASIGMVLFKCAGSEFVDPLTKQKIIVPSTVKRNGVWGTEYDLGEVDAAANLGFKKALWIRILLKTLAQLRKFRRKLHQWSESL